MDFKIKCRKVSLAIASIDIAREETAKFQSFKLLEKLGNSTILYNVELPSRIYFYYLT